MTKIIVTFFDASGIDFGNFLNAHSRCKIRFPNYVTSRMRAPAHQSPLLSSSYFEVLSIDSTVAISCLSLKELIYLNENKEKDKNQEVHEKKDVDVSGLDMRLNRLNT